VIRRRGVAGLAGGVLGVWKSYRYFVSVTDKLLSREKLPRDVESQA